MRFYRSRTQILYRYVPGAVFEHDHYGTCRVTDVTMTAADSLNISGIQRMLASYLLLWRGFGDDAFPDPYDEWHEYRVGIPDRVNFEPFPSIVECSNCGHINDLSQLRNLPMDTPPVCTQCHKGKYRQLPYMTIHNCGKLSPVPVPPCPVHGNEYLTFVDTGRFVTAYWQCEKCSYTRGMPRYRCQCAFSRTITDDSDSYKRNMQYVRTNDTSVLYSHVLPMVNLSEDNQTLLRQDSQSHALLLAKQWSLIEGNIFEVASERAKTSQNTDNSRQMQELIEKLRQKGGEDDTISQLSQLVHQIGTLPEQDKVETVIDLAPEVRNSQPSQSLLEHVAILESLNVIDEIQVRANVENRNDNPGLYDLDQGFRFAKERLGFQDIWCITDFPVAMVSVGYSRGSKSRGDALLAPFRPDRSAEGKVPLYVVTSTAEGIMIQLNPIRVARWLIDNNLASGKYPQDHLSSWAWCKRTLSRLSLFRGIVNAPEDLNIAEKATITLLHTISHLLLKHIEWSGFDPESVGEYILPETLSIIIHSNNYSSFNIGGMVTLYEQRLHGWLRDTYNAAFNCVYNPICEDEGASCAGCLHRQYNCEGFNQFLSRSVLQGGFVPEIERTVSGYWMVNIDQE